MQRDQLIALKKSNFTKTEKFENVSTKKSFALFEKMGISFWDIDKSVTDYFIVKRSV